jgi:hypothetical protein
LSDLGRSTNVSLGQLGSDAPERLLGLADLEPLRGALLEGRHDPQQHELSLCRLRKRLGRRQGRRGRVTAV